MDDILKDFVVKALELADASLRCMNLTEQVKHTTVDHSFNLSTLAIVNVSLGKKISRCLKRNFYVYPN